MNPLQEKYVLDHHIGEALQVLHQLHDGRRHVVVAVAAERLGESVSEHTASVLVDVEEAAA